MTYSSEVLADSPLLYWKLDETSGTAAADSSGHGRGGAHTSGLTVGTASLLGDGSGKSVTYAGTANVYTRIAYAAWMNTAAFTVEARVKPAAADLSPADASIILGRDGTPPSAGSRVFNFAINSDNKFAVAANLGGTVQVLVGTTIVTAGTTYTVAGKYDGATLSLWVNGAQEATFASTAGLAQPTSADFLTGNIGLVSNNAGYAFGGTLDEVSWYGTALSDARLQAHHSAAIGAASPTTVNVYLGQLILNGTAQPLSITPTITSHGDTRNRGASLQQLSGLGRSTVTVPVAATPANITVGAAVEKAFSLPAITLDNGRAVDVQPAWFEQPAKRFRVLVDGHDVTYFRGYRMRVGGYKLTEPYSYGATNLEIDVVHPAFEVLGTDDHTWARKGAKVRFDLVDSSDAVVKEGVYRGRVVARRAGSATLEIGGALSGPATLRYRATPLYRETFDVGRLAWQACKHLGVPMTPRLGPATGIEVVSTGGQDYLGHMDYLCAMSAKKDGSSRAFTYVDGKGWQFPLKDRTTKDFTVWLDGARVVADLVDDAAEQPNAYYLSGVAPSGRRMKGSVYPGMIQGDTPPYPFNDGRTFGVGTTNAQTDTGDGITVMVNRLVGAGYLSMRDDFGGGEFTDDVADAIDELREDAGLTQNGQMSTKAWDALYDLSVTGLTMAQAHIQPMVVDSSVKKYDRTSTGAISGVNDGWDGGKSLRVDRNVDFGFGVTRPQMRQWARQDMARAKDSWTGTITLYSDVFRGEYVHGGANPQVMSKFEIAGGMNAWVPNFNGGTLFHVSYLDANPEDNTVTLTVDTQARDAVDLAAIIARNREARRNPEAEWIRDHRRSRQVQDSVVEWDEYAGFLYSKVTCPGNRWTVFPVISGGEGTVARIRVQTDTPAAYVLGVFGRNPGRRRLTKRVPHPLDTHSGVTRVDVTNGGTGYTSAPDVVITRSGSNGAGARAVATISGGKVTAVTVTNPGAGYTDPPTVTFANGGGSGASATAVISTGADRWTDQDLQDWLWNERLCVYVAGDSVQPCGYWPKTHTDENGDTTAAPVTGTWQDDAGFGYRTFKTPLLWVAIFPDRDTVLKPQHLMYDQLEPGI